MTAGPAADQGAGAEIHGSTGLPSAARTRAIGRAAMRACADRGWAAVTEMPLANGRRADLLALRPDGDFAIIEVKSGARDFMSDGKWPEYRAFCDFLYFAVDLDFPRILLPTDVGLFVADGLDATLLHAAPRHGLAPARRRALLQRFATVAAMRLAALDPAVASAFRVGTSPD